MARVDPPIFLMFAGPNGSGKSTITQAFRARESFPANYINADEIAVTLVGDSPDMAYQAARIAEAQRQELMGRGESLGCETVMSHPSKLALLEQATNLGYRVILVFVATNDPQINIERVSLRVRQGGHDVPRDKIIARYNRALQLLPAAVELADFVYIFDNTQTAELFVTVVNGSSSIIQQPIPNWIEKGLILRQSQRFFARERLRAFARDRNLPLESASLVSGRYTGAIISLDRDYALQLVGDKAIVHDLSIVKLPQTSSSGLEINYDGGVVTVIDRSPPNS